MMIVFKVFILWSLIILTKWSNCSRFDKPTTTFNDDTQIEINNTINNNNVNKFSEIRSTTAMLTLSSTESNTMKIQSTTVSSVIKLEGDSGYTFLNIGVLMASHLGNK